MKIRQGILKLNDLCPDGVRIIVNWDNMVTSSSVFILCVNTQVAIEQAKKITTARGWQTETQVRVEDGKLGVRIWRTV
jgi:hypothetical protein|tara:strand:- start:103 stop:336 length:234 start_codon:yes stop_codon:yes gene_type:complete